MSSTEHAFLFASLESKRPRTARKVHIRRLYDIFQLSLQRGDFARARRAWAILVRCKEIDWKAMWRAAVLLIDDASDDDAELDEARIPFLSTMMRQHPEDREDILKELTLRLIRIGKYRRALDELDLHLPSFPYQDNPVLHVYSGLLCLYLAQPPPDGSNRSWDAVLLRDAKARLERALNIDPDNAIATAFIEQIPTIAQGSPAGRDAPESEDEDGGTRGSDDDGDVRSVDDEELWSESGSRRKRSKKRH